MRIAAIFLEILSTLISLFVLYSTILFWIFLLEPSIPTFCSFASLLNLNKSLTVTRLFVGSPSNLLTAIIERSVALFSASEKPYSLPHCNLTAEAAEMHILSTFLFYRSLESVGVDMPWIETMNLLNIFTLFAFKSAGSLIRIRRRSAWILISTQFRNGNVTKWLKYAKHSFPIMKSSLGKYVLQDSTNWLVPSTSSTIICNTSFASSIDNVAFPSFANHLCWYRKTLLLTPYLSHMK